MYFYGFTYYNVFYSQSNYAYHKIHVRQTESLYDITNEKILLEYHEKWESCEELCHFALRKIDKWIVNPIRNITS